MGKGPKSKVKICGITNWRDARRAIEAGADFLGFNFYAGSPRYIAPEKAQSIVRRMPKRVVAVGVFVNESEKKMAEIARSVGLEQLQLHGDETPAVVRRLSQSFSSDQSRTRAKTISRRAIEPLQGCEGPAARQL